MKKLKTFIGWTIYLSIILMGGIILFGGIDYPLFPYVFFTFALTMLLILVFVGKDLFDRPTIILLIVSTILISLSATFYASQLKNYDNTKRLVDNTLIGLNDDLAVLNSKNAYYSDYVDYELSVLAQYQNLSMNQLGSLDTSSLSASAIKDNTIKQLTVALSATKKQLADTQTQLAQAQADLENQEPQIIYIEREDDD